MSNHMVLLGWGSLLWDTIEKFDVWREPWQPDGPAPKIEFSRVSDKRQKALTLVIDPEHGIDNVVFWALSRRSRLDQVIDDLKKREETGTHRIGVYSIEGLERGFDSESFSRIRSWADEHSVHSVVWTDLPSNFAEKTEISFSIDNALKHLETLPNEVRKSAVEYIRKAPNSVRTPLRTAVAQRFNHRTE